VGRDSIGKWGGRVVIIPEVKGASTTGIVDKIKKIYS
jgi:bifunctional ADP-heptose synthase (sugar kinase/adenylyltransferase)